MTRSYADAVALAAPGRARRSIPAKIIAEDGALISLACVLGIVETWLPAPIPGARLGLANVAILVALARSGWLRAARVSVCKVLLVAVATGGFGGPTFALSLTGAAASLAAMAASARSKRFSVIGVSASGSFAHVSGQLIAASSLISSSAVAAIATPALLASIPLGMVTGAAASALISRLEGVGSPGW